MGVVNNFIKIMDILHDRPKARFITQPVDTDATTVRIETNIMGYRYHVVNADTGDIMANATSGTSGANISLTSISSTGHYQIRLFVYGGNAMEPAAVSRVFTVTRGAAAQTLAAGKMDMKGDLSETADLKDESI